MEIKLTQKEFAIWSESKACTRRAQVSTELVIPDTMEDVNRVVWTHGMLFLKGKEPAIHETKVMAEAAAQILVLTESGKLDAVSASKAFDLSFETENTDEEALPQLYLDLPLVEARMLNPRKLSLTFDVQARLKNFSRAKLTVDSTLPEGDWTGTHLLREELDALALTQVKEKMMTVREQISLPPEWRGMKKIAGEEIRFENLSTEQIGNRCVVKGELCLFFSGLDEGGKLLQSQHRISFSQLLEAGEEQMDFCTLRIEPCSVYLEAAEGAGEEKSLDLELHAVLQACSYTKTKIRTIRDAYSTRLPVTAMTAEYSLLREITPTTVLVREEKRIPCPDDLEEIVAAEAKLGPLEPDSGCAWIPLTMDLLYQKKDGGWDAARRSTRIRVTGEQIGAEYTETVLRSFSVRKQEDSLLAGCEAELLQLCVERDDLLAVTGLMLEDDKAWKAEEIPGLVLVRRTGESLWELAKAYHSSRELIEACNPEESEMLLIPAE